MLLLNRTFSRVIDEAIEIFFTFYVLLFFMHFCTHRIFFSSDFMENCVENKRWIMRGMSHYSSRNYVTY